ncbi:lumican [Chiloscyllium plagiosum]|uniref:lumican n=1 Tax=Chiloscyllium plagiosum TaxID=36176 RepID=UPI001CB7E78D|nr:lumican [Chiloscyllium plagiosum]
MKAIQLPIFALLVSSILCQYDYNEYFGYYNLINLQAPTYPVCSVECDCPLNFPTAMYCNHRKLKTIPLVPAEIKYLYLHSNQLTGIPNNAFENATGLQWLVLDDNQITSDNVGKNAFSKLKSLKRLYLNRNNLTDVVRGLPKSLKELRLSSNRISKVGNTLRGLENLTTLQLNDNKLKDVGSLSGLKSLTYLDLSGNQLAKLPDDPPEGIEMFYVTNNNIKSIPKDYFNKIKDLQYLRMSHNEITDDGIPDKIFNITSLIELDLAYNDLKSIPLVNERLENLYLQANKIDKFTLQSFCRVTGPLDFSSIRHLRLDGNNISRASVPYDLIRCLPLASDITLDF